MGDYVVRNNQQPPGTDRRGTKHLTVDKSSQYHFTINEQSASEAFSIGENSMVISYTSPTTGAEIALSPPMLNLKLQEMFKELLQNTDEFQHGIDSARGADKERITRWLQTGHAHCDEDFPEPKDLDDVGAWAKYKFLIKEKSLPKIELSEYTKFLLASVSLPHFRSTFMFHGSTQKKISPEALEASISYETRTYSKDYWTKFYHDQNQKFGTKSSVGLVEGMGLGMVIKRIKMNTGMLTQYSKNQVKFTPKPILGITLGQNVTEFTGPLQIGPCLSDETFTTIMPMLKGGEPERTTHYHIGRFDQHARDHGYQPDMFSPQALNPEIEMPAGTKSIFTDVAMAS